MTPSFLFLVAFLVVGIGIGVVGFLEFGSERVAGIARVVFYVFVALVVVGLFLGLLTDASRAG